ncbi:hypothetical protein RR42_m2702 [Cupriavidus basilensis]|uniref:Uncharacterized protein n=1 Tax=Cupriavidus basilensis TaxID=68895 RepID=A0A0C4Y457_9BURK|nr:hypothetical protein RR42_m2702 [Cupriavidus basilensis]
MFFCDNPGLSVIGKWFVRRNAASAISASSFWRFFSRFWQWQQQQHGKQRTGYPT